MFAGPNGSGKSTIKNAVPSGLLGFYINADDLELELKQTLRLDVSSLGITLIESEIKDFFMKSGLGSRIYVQNNLQAITASSNGIHFKSVVMDSYVASVLADFLRNKLLDAGTSFTFETVMSHSSKSTSSEKPKGVDSAPTFTS
jgi:predicted ABC-type ATPase